MDTELKQYNIYAGLNCDFDNIEYKYTVLAETKDEATQIAFDEACNEYDMYEGTNGLLTYDDCIEICANEIGADLTEEGEPSEDICEAANSMYFEERDTQIKYYAILTSEDTISKDDLILDYVIDNSDETFSE